MRPESNADRSEHGRSPPFNAALLHFHRECIRHRFAFAAASVTLYAALMLVLGSGLGVSSNFFVILPLIAAALGFGSPGGIIAGALGLPANLLVFEILGHPEFSPASKLMAEVSGLTLGLALGLLSDYFEEVGREIRRRESVEDSLREALAEKELLLRELQHRVKNNLNVMKSLVMLQRSRSRNPEFIETADELVGRIFAMAMVHDRLYGDSEAGKVGLGDYVSSLTEHLASSLGIDESRIARKIDARGRTLSSESAMPLGLIVNEVFMNAAKHAKTEDRPYPSISVALVADGPEYRLTIEDDGPGPSGGEISGLGMKLIASLSANLSGSASLSPIMDGGRVAGTRFELSWREGAAPGEAEPPPPGRTRS